MHIATNVLREVTRNLGAKTNKVSVQGGALLSAQSHPTRHMHKRMQVLSQVPTGLLSRSQQVCSPVPTGLLYRPQQVSSPGPNGSHHQVPTGVIGKCGHVSSPGRKRSHLRCLCLLTIARHHRPKVLCLLLCLSGLGVALHQLLFHALILQLQLPDPFPARCPIGPRRSPVPCAPSQAAWSAGQ